MPCDPVFRHLILGSGPAGLTAGLYAARSNCCPLIIKGGTPGGQLTQTTSVENYPGFPEGVDGQELMAKMEAQARRFGANVVNGQVTSVDLSAYPFEAWVGETCYRGRTLILSTGASPKMLGLSNEWDLVGRGVSVCATCDAFFYKGKKVVVVGGGDTAMGEAAFLARFASEVVVVHRRKSLRAVPPMQERARKNKRVSFRLHTLVTEILGDRQNGVRGVRLKDLDRDVEEEIACDGVFVAIGHRPNTALFRGQLELDAEGYIVTRNFTETSVPGVFAAGDVQDRFFRQAVTAAGSGCMAAMQAEGFLESREEEPT
jgi:thioredoxin reductase (NADPH)